MDTRAIKLAGIYNQLENCRECDFAHSRSNVVMGEGSIAPKLIMVGEAPGRQEDESGSPFVGAAGDVLNKAIHDAGYLRSNMYITNTIKCRPPQNRDPKAKEIQRCVQHLKKELKIFDGTNILLLGKTALSLVDKWSSIGESRGIAHRVTMFDPKENIPTRSLRDLPENAKMYEFTAYVTYHPAYVLRAGQSAYEKLVKDILHAVITK